MRIEIKVTLLTGIFGILSLTSASSQSVPRRSPHNGDIYQNNNYADSFFSWLNVGGWKGAEGSIPAFELGIVVDASVFDSCTSWTTLPSGYDDCPTAGVLEPDWSKKTYSVGSYDARQISANYQYYAQWNFSGGTQTVSNYKITWKEGWNFCDGGATHSPWCIDSVDGGVLVNYVFSKSVESLRNWKWRDNSLAGTGSSRIEPDATYYYSGGPSRHSGTLSGPQSADFDLYLFYWTGSTWQVVKGSTSTSSSESVEYNGPPGYYEWLIYSYAGSGSYQFGATYKP